MHCPAEHLIDPGIQPQSQQLLKFNNVGFNQWTFFVCRNNPTQFKNFSSFKNARHPRISVILPAKWNDRNIIGEFRPWNSSPLLPSQQIQLLSSLIVLKYPCKCRNGITIIFHGHNLRLFNQTEHSNCIFFRILWLCSFSRTIFDTRMYLALRFTPLICQSS